MSAALTPRSIGFALVMTVPELGGSNPASTRRSVDFPDPLRPMIPTNSPERAVNETPRNAATETICLRRNVLSRSLRGARSVRITLYRTRRLWATTVSGDSSGATQRSDSPLFGTVRLLPLPEEQQPEEEIGSAHV